MNKFPCVPNYYPANRQEKRAMVNELTRINEQFWTIEQRFYKALFDPEDKRSYNELYTELMDSFNRIKARVKNKATHVIPDYYADNAPQL